MHGRRRSKDVGAPAEYVGNHPAASHETTKSGKNLRVCNYVRLENLLAATVSRNMEVDPIFVRLHEIIFAFGNQISEILACSSRVIVEHSSLAGDELSESSAHTCGSVLVVHILAYRKST